MSINTQSLKAKQNKILLHVPNYAHSPLHPSLTAQSHNRTNAQNAT